MSKYCSLLVLAGLVTTSASAQTTFHFGVRAGANLAQEHYQSSSGNTSGYSYQSTFSALLRGQAGLVFEARRGKFAFQPALLFSQKGGKTESSNSFSPGGRDLRYVVGAVHDAPQLVGDAPEHGLYPAR